MTARFDDNPSRSGSRDHHRKDLGQPRGGGASGRARAALTSISIWCTKSPRRRPFDGLRERGLKVRRPDLTIATADHSMPTTPRGLPIVDKIAATQVEQLGTELQGVRHPLLRAR